jgi:L-ascorbate metabolism protein UlaG (beta-lactamase superfamily)
MRAGFASAVISADVREGNLRATAMTPRLSDHFDGQRFFNPGAADTRGVADLLRWKLTSRPARWPDRVAVAPSPVPPPPAAGGLALTWIGHSSFLLRSATGAWLTDPVFSEQIGPVSGWGPRRVAPPGLRPEALPKIDGVLLSHDHFDHCDLPSLRLLAAQGAGPLVVAPLNYGFLGRAAAQLAELDWWQTLPGPGDVSIQLVPARHWCRRRLFGTNLRLWGGFMVHVGGRRLYFAGDTGYDPALFREIRRRCGPPDVALLPIGAYEPRWFMRDSHMNPAEAVQAHREVGARRSLGMHWGTFQLTDEAREAPLDALEAARVAAGLGPEEFQVLPIGGTTRIP